MSRTQEDAMKKTQIATARTIAGAGTVFAVAPRVRLVP
jgi:hypothetical protein